MAETSVKGREFQNSTELCIDRSDSGMYFDHANDDDDDEDGDEVFRVSPPSSGSGSLCETPANIHNERDERDDISVIAQPLDLEGSIVVGGNVRRSSFCSCSSSSSGSSISCDTGVRRKSYDTRSTCSYSPTPESRSDPGEELPYPGFPAVTLYCMSQTTHPRDWCLKLVTNPYPFFCGVLLYDIPVGIMRRKITKSTVIQTRIERESDWEKPRCRSFDELC